MHIVLLSDTLPPDSPGGAGKIAWQLGQGLIAAGHRVTFITSTPDTARVEDRQGIPVHLLHSRYPVRLVAWIGLFNPQTVWPLNFLLRRLKPDVVHAHNIHRHLSYHSLVIAQHAKAATVFTAHDVMTFAYTKLTRFIDPDRPDQTDGWDYRLPLGYNWRQMRLRWNPARNLSIRHTMHYYVNEHVAVSDALRQALEANRLVQFRTVHNGLDPAAFDVPEAGSDVLRQRLKLNGRRVILFGGRLSREKGDRQLLAALRQVKERAPEVALLVLSQSSDYAEQLVRDHPDLADHIILGGWLQDAELATAYWLADVVASPSVCFDSFPTVNLEGMAAGAVPVTTCFGGGREAVIDGETGFVVNPYNVDALANRLTRLLTDEPLRRRMAEAGRERLIQHFTLRHQAEAMLDVYEQALTEKRDRVHQPVRRALSRKAGGNPVGAEQEEGARKLGWWGRLLALIVGVLLALALVEIAGRLLFGFDPLPSWAQDFNNRVGYELRPHDEYTYVSLSGEFENTIRTNSRGLHDVEHTLNKPEEVFRLLILSDSYGQAREVPLEVNFARQLEVLLNEAAPENMTFEVINAGYYGVGTTQEYLYYTTEGYRYDPDLVLVGFYVGNDVVDNHAPLIKAWQRIGTVDFPYYAPDGTLHQPGMATRRRVLSWLRQNVYLVNTVSRIWGDTGHPDRVEVGDPAMNTEHVLRVPMGIYLPPDTVWEDGWTATRHALADLDAAVRADGGQLAVFVIPDHRQVYENEWLATLDHLPDLDPADLDRERPTQTIMALLEMQGIPALSLLESFRAANEPLFFEIDGHFNPAGHALVAQTLAAWLHAAALIPQSEADE